MRDMFSKSGLIPQKQIVLLSSGNYQEQGFLINHVEMRLYLEKRDSKRGPFSIVTIHIETNKGSTEMELDKGYFGLHALEETAAYVTSHPVLSGIILQAVLLLKNSTEEQLVVNSLNM